MAFNRWNSLRITLPRAGAHSVRRQVTTFLKGDEKDTVGGSIGFKA
jgi:hypothetical protein